MLCVYECVCIWVRVCVCDESKRKSPIIGSWKWFPCFVKSTVRDFERADWLTNTELAIDTALLRPRLTNMKGPVPRQTNEKKFFFSLLIPPFFLTSHLLYSSLSTWFKEENKNKKDLVFLPLPLRKDDWHNQITILHNFSLISLLLLN